MIRFTRISLMSWMFSLSIFILSSCQLVSSESEELNSTLTKKEVAQQWQQVNNCGSCHLSAPKTGEHQLHLADSEVIHSDDNPNGVMTCADCHSLSVQSLPSENPDLFFNKNITIADIRHLDGGTSFEDVQAFLTQYFEDGITPSYKTTLYHKNGTIDVSFPQSNLEFDENFDRVPATYNFKTRTCSSLACHGEEKW